MIRRLRAPILCLLAGLGGCVALAPAERRIELDELRIEALQDVELDAEAGTVRAVGDDPRLSLRRLPRGGRGRTPATIGLEIGLEPEPGPGDWELLYVSASRPGDGFKARDAVTGHAESRTDGTALRFELPEPATRLRLDPPPGSEFSLRSIVFEEMPAGWRQILRTFCGAAAAAGALALLFGLRALRRPGAPAAPERRRPAVGKILLAALLGSVALQIGAMILTSRYDAHPDEKSHSTVAEYYLRWWLPPPAGDPRIIPSFSRYGHSYHYNKGAAYFLAGKAVAPFERLARPPFQAFRWFNFGLFALLAVSALRRRERTYALLLLLLPAQVWYLFSYWNDDALALFACLVCVWQLVDPRAACARFLAADGWKTGWHGALLFALLAAVLRLSKSNYNLFLLFLGLYAAWTVATSGGWRRGRALTLKWGLIALLALGFAWPRLAVDRWVNDPARSPFGAGLTQRQIVVEQAEKHALPGFKPSEIGTGSADTTFAMRRRGVPFWKLFTEYRWHELTFKSFVGLYGYMDLFSSRAFYLAILVTYVALLVTLGSAVWRRGTPTERWFGLGVALFALGFVLISAYYSWTVDFQAQGRYLFPLFAVLFIALLRLRTLIPERLLWRYGVVIWLLSSYSFIFTALRWIPKLG